MRPPTEVAAAIAQVREVLRADSSVRIATSGSTGQPAEIVLPARALRASAEATALRLGGVGRWVLALPVDHIAGLQVLVRAQLAAAARVPNALVAAERPASKTPALSQLLGRALADPPAPVFVSLVATQLRRALSDPTCTARLAACQAVLLGGGPCPAHLLERARAQGINVVTTYGMTETAGGCVYDGIPLEGVQVRLADLADGGAGRIEIAGPVLAQGCGPWLRTNDLGRFDESGRLVVLGRMDDVIITGGLNVHPDPVAAALSQALDGSEVHVVGVPDPEWGSAVTAIVVGDYPPARLADARDQVAAALGAPAAPKRFVQVPAIPLLASGKPDRTRLRAIAVEQTGAAR